MKKLTDNYIENTSILDKSLINFNDTSDMKLSRRSILGNVNDFKRKSLTKLHPSRHLLDPKLESTDKN